MIFDEITGGLYKMDKVKVTREDLNIERVE